MEPKKRNNGTISFSDKSQKEEVRAILREKRLQNLMPADIKGKDGKMVLWAIRYLKNLADTGKIRLEVPLFEEESQELQQLKDDNQQLRQENQKLRGTVYMDQVAVKAACHKVRLTPERAKSIMDDCLFSVVKSSPYVFDERVE